MKGYDEVITEAEPEIGPSAPPGVEYLSPLTMLEFEIEQLELIESKKASLKLANDEETKPVIVKLTEFTADGTLKFEFNQDLEIPPFARESKDSRRRLSLDQIDARQIFDIFFKISSDVSPREIKYTVLISNWTE